MIATTIILLGFEKSEVKEADIDYRKLGEYHLGQALMSAGLDG